MKNAPLTQTRLLVGFLALLFLEGATFYAYSLLWLADATPSMTGNPLLNRLEYICFGAILIEPLLVYWWVFSTRDK